MPKPTKMPRARVMWQYTADMGQTCLNDVPLKDGGTEQCVLVLPMPSLKSARQRAKFENLSEGEKVERLKRVIDHSATDGYIARACLAVMEGST